MLIELSPKGRPAVRQCGGSVVPRKCDGIVARLELQITQHIPRQTAVMIAAAEVPVTLSREAPPLLQFFVWARSLGYDVWLSRRRSVGSNPAVPIYTLGGLVLLYFLRDQPSLLSFSLDEAAAKVSLATVYQKHSSLQTRKSTYRG